MVGGVRCKQTNQEKNDKRLAIHLVNGQKEEEKKRLQQIEHRNRQLVELENPKQEE